MSLLLLTGTGTTSTATGPPARITSSSPTGRINATTGTGVVITPSAGDRTTIEVG